MSLAIVAPDLPAAQEARKKGKLNVVALFKTWEQAKEENWQRLAGIVTWLETNRPQKPWGRSEFAEAFNAVPLPPPKDHCSDRRALQLVPR